MIAATTKVIVKPMLSLSAIPIDGAIADINTLPIPNTPRPDAILDGGKLSPAIVNVNDPTKLSPMP